MNKDINHFEVFFFCFFFWLINTLRNKAFMWSYCHQIVPGNLILYNSQAVLFSYFFTETSRNAEEYKRWPLPKSVNSDFSFP